MKWGRNLVTVLVFTVVTVLLTLELAHVISDNGHAGDHVYSARFTDATGVVVGDDVRLAGVQVGQVRALRIVDRTTAEVQFAVDSGVPVYRDARMQIRYRNLIGQRYLALVETRHGQAALPRGATIGLGRTTPALNLTTLFNGFKPLFQALQPSQVNELAGQIIATLQGEGGTVGSLLSTTASLTSTIAGKDAVIGRVIDNLGTVLATVDARDSSVNSLIRSFRTLMGGLAQDRTTIGDALPHVADLASTTGDLLHDARPDLRSDVVQLRTLTGQLASTKGDLDEVLRVLPNKLNVITRAGSYGSWFNFYVCGLDIQLSLLGKSIQLSTPVGLQTGDKGTVCESGDQ